MRSALAKRLEPAMVAGRVPPHDLDAEAAVLSAVLLSREALDKVLEILKPEHFYSDANGRIYEAAQQLALEGKPIDIVSVASWLRDRERLAQIGGPSYLGQLADATPAVAHVGAHAAVVYEKWRLRQLIATCQKVAAEGYGDVGVVQEFIDGAEQAVYELARTASSSSIEHIGDAIRSTYEQMAAATERGDKIAGISTGFERLDAKIGGLRVSHLNLVAARPGMGKTTFVLNLAVNVASQRSRKFRGKEILLHGPGVGVFSLEMPKQELTARMVCSEARVDLGRHQCNALLPQDWRKITDASVLISPLPIWLDFCPGLGLLELRAKVRRLQAEYNREETDIAPERKVGLIIVDYLQLMKGREGITSREQEISEISRGLKQLAGELGVAIVANSQLNRKVEEQPGKAKRPQLMHLRESGALEQDADTVIFIYRDEYYNPETTNAKGIAELIIAKQRSGPTGRVFTRFTDSCTRFDNLSEVDYPLVYDGDA